MTLDDIERTYRLNKDVRLIVPGLMVVGSTNNNHLNNINVHDRYMGSIREVL